MGRTGRADRLHRVLASVPRRIVACSGGVDSLLLATLAHRAQPVTTIVAHTVTAAVPGAATGRVIATAEAEGWHLELVRSDEFEDERYLANPTDRCYFCKSHLYGALGRLADRFAGPAATTILSGANRDDLGEYRPGLTAAAERGVRHPYLEADLGKADVRDVARRAGLSFADLPASPCLASRLYTGTRVTEARLRAVDAGEEVIRCATGIDVVRCRIRADEVVVEVTAPDRPLVTDEVLERAGTAMRTVEPGIASVCLDDRPYRPGQAVLTAT